MGNAGGDVIGGAGEDGMALCPSCGQPLGVRALFCHHCGALQPPRAVDPFSRLGVERQFDLDQARIDRQFAGFSRVLTPERFAERPRAQQAAARAQLAALKDAHRHLSDPLLRARSLLLVNGFDLSMPGSSDTEAGTGDEAALLASLKAAFRVRALNDAASILLQLERLAGKSSGTPATRPE